MNDKYKYRAVLARLEHTTQEIINNAVYVLVSSNFQRLRGFCTGAMRFDDEFYNITTSDRGQMYLTRLDKGEIDGEIV